LFYSQLLLIRDSKFRATFFMLLLDVGCCSVKPPHNEFECTKIIYFFLYHGRIATRWIHRKWAVNYIKIPFTKNRCRNLMLSIFSTEKIGHFRVFSRRQKTKACDDLSVLGGQWFLGSVWKKAAICPFTFLLVNTSFTYSSTSMAKIRFENQIILRFMPCCWYLGNLN